MSVIYDINSIKTLMYQNNNAKFELRPPFNKLIFIRIIMIKYSETNLFDSKPRNILPKNYRNRKMLIK